MRASGLVIIDKPDGISSFEVVRRVRRITGARKAGHSGTLDPFAKGVLLVCLNEATKIVPLLVKLDKEYEGTIRLGIETDTGDITGKVLKEVEVPASISERRVTEVFRSFQGELNQVPPAFSAKKRGGVALYRFARQGQAVEPEPVRVRVESMELTAFEPPELSFRVVCSKGTYIRALARDIGRSLGCGAHLTRLRRTRVGAFGSEEAIPIGELKERLYQGPVDRVIRPLEAIPLPLRSVTVAEGAEEKLRQGQRLWASDLLQIEGSFMEKGEKLKVLSCGGRLVAIAEALFSVEESRDNPCGRPLIQPVRIFHDCNPMGCR